MNYCDIIISILIALGTGILLFNLLKIDKNIKLHKNIKSANNKNLPRLILIHKSFILLLIFGYAAIFFCYIYNVHIWLEFLLGPVLFLGACCFFLGTNIKKKFFKVTKNELNKAIELNKELHEEQKDLLASERKYRSILENIDESYFEADLQGSLMFFNDSTCKIMGYEREELMGVNYATYVDKKTVDRVYKIYNRLYKQKSGRDSVEYNVISKDGTKRSIETSISVLCDEKGRPVGFSGLARDITEKKNAEKKQKQLENQILQAQKLEAIGHLAGGIAHDFNNILTAISGNAKLLMIDKENLSEKRQNNLTNIMSATERAGTLINQVLTFSRQKEDVLFPVRFDLILKEAIRFIRSTTSTSIDIKTNINTANQHIFADSTQIHQVIMNLCTNAKYAMENQNNGTIDINLSAVELNTFTGLAGNILSGTFFELSIKDTGEGMPPEILEKIFNPFFTTKGQEKGTGLGLSTVHGIVKSYGGDISVKSEVGKGTTFKVYLPVTDKENFEQESISENKVQGKGTILLLDDESWITESFGELFSDYGYKVDVFNSSEEALKAVDKNRGRYDVVVTDFQMPQMNGLEFAEKLKKINNNIAIIICSGDLSSIPKEKANALNLHAMVQKPFDDDKLAQIIQEAIDKK